MITRQTTDKMVKQVYEWNKANPPGTPVTRYELVNPLRNGHETKTTTEAWILAGHTPVVMVAGVSGCVGLSSVVPNPSHHDGAAPAPSVDGVVGMKG